MIAELTQLIETDLNSIQNKYNWMIKTINNDIYNGTYDPDINGFTMIYFIPPDFSAFPDNVKAELTNISKKMVFLATEFIPPEIQVNVSQYGGGSGNLMPFPTGIGRSGNLSINYIENSEQEILTFHNFWIEYIDGILKGKIRPNSSYLTDDYPIIDYMGAAYVVKFNRNMNKVTYIGKASGIFPLGVNSKPVFGDRSKNEISILSVNYTCARFDNATSGISSINATNKLSTDIFNEFAIQVNR